MRRNNYPALRIIPGVILSVICSLGLLLYATSSFTDELYGSGVLLYILGIVFCISLFTGVRAFMCVMSGAILTFFLFNAIEYGASTASVIISILFGLYFIALLIDSISFAKNDNRNGAAGFFWCCAIMISAIGGIAMIADEVSYNADPMSIWVYSFILISLHLFCYWGLFVPSPAERYSHNNGTDNNNYDFFDYLNKEKQSTNCAPLTAVSNATPDSSEVKQTDNTAPKAQNTTLIPQNNASKSPSVSKASDLMDSIARAKKMYDDGALSEEEYIRLKEILLSDNRQK